MSWEEDLKQHLGAFSWPEVPADLAGITSVLAPLVWNEEAKRGEILLMKRSELVESHKGQISFPGGYREMSDLDLLHTALREVEEEIGVKREAIEILGRLAPVRTRGDVLIYPWVGRLRVPYPFVLNPAEVDRLLFLPAAQLVAEGLSPVEVPMGAVKVKSIGLMVQGELVWGATARMLQELREHLMAVPALMDFL